MFHFTWFSITKEVTQCYPRVFLWLNVPYYLSEKTPYSVPVAIVFSKKNIIQPPVLVFEDKIEKSREIAITFTLQTTYN